MLVFRAAIVVAAIALPLAAQRDPLFKTEILPVLEKNCVGCHGPDRKMAKLDLSSFTGMMEGSSSGPVIAPGKPERSLMWKLIETGQMPQGGKLTAAEKQLIKSYIQYGRFPQATTETETAARAREAAKISQKDREWWSFRKPVKSPVPRSPPKIRSVRRSTLLSSRSSSAKAGRCSPRRIVRL